MKRAQEVQAVAHAAQIAQLTALIKAAASGKEPPPAPTTPQGGGGRVLMNPAGTRRVRHPPPKGAMTGEPSERSAAAPRTGSHTPTTPASS